MRSKLFVPGSRPELFGKALASAADAISIDLKASVTEERKPEARLNVQTLLKNLPASNKKIIVRTNHVSTSHFQLDVAYVAQIGLDILNIPKVEDPEEIHEAAKLLIAREKDFQGSKNIGILVNIESPKGLRRAKELAAAHPKVIGLQIGYGDLFSPLEIARENVSAIAQVMFSVRMAAGEANIFAMDGAFTHVSDTEGFKSEALLAKQMGYIGKSCIHPSQIEMANFLFRPSDSDIAYSLKVLSALNDSDKKGVGAFMVDGHMVDVPIFERAKQIIYQAEQLGLVFKSI